MRIKAIRASNIPPVQEFEVNDLSDLVVVAGPNAVGKSRLIDSLLAYFQNFTGSTQLIIEATDKTETAAWKKRTLDTSLPADVQLLRTTLQQNRRRRNFSSSVLYYESDRSIQKVDPLQFQWDIPDPWEEQIGWNVTFGGLRSRWTDTLHAIFKKIESQKKSISNRAVLLKRDGHSSMNLEFSDPLIPFRDAFSQLLAPKTLEDADLQNQTLRYKEADGATRDITTLSSGEREVLNITFDFILRRPSHCIVFFDEPELHLHPELSAKLISTLKTVGVQNQFILCTHSPDIIATSLDDSVVFLTPPKPGGGNQAIVVRADDETSEALHRLGQSVGVVALGKKIVLIEGTQSSLDKQTYTHLLKNHFPDLVLLPSGGKGNLHSFNTVINEVLDHAIWGVDFFMLADRDALPAGNDPNELTVQSKGRFRTLSRYHLENYFLDADVLAKVFQDMESDASWLSDAAQIENELRKIAATQVSYATALIASKYVRDNVGNLNIMPKDCHGKDKGALQELMAQRLADEKARIETGLEPDALAQYIEKTYDSISNSISAGGNQWRIHIPGKPIFKIFCNCADLAEGRLKTLYIAKAIDVPSKPFKELIEIFQSFSDLHT